jgi:acyl carrier protein
VDAVIGPGCYGVDGRTARNAASAHAQMAEASGGMSTIHISAGERVTEVVRRLLADRSINTSFTAQDDLREVGLTSLDMVNLVLAVESELAVSIPEAEITPNNFRSVSAIEALVTGLRNESASRFN